MRVVKDVIKSMLVERVAHAMCDSGSAYGYTHERNATRDFDNEPEVFVDLNMSEGTSDDLDYTINTYHYLTKGLEFDAVTEQINNELTKIREADEGEYPIEYPHWAQECMNVVKDMVENGDIEGDKIDITDVVNTYNHESRLDSVLQYNCFSIDDNYYVLLQIHGGCDVRGGYTDAMCFKVPSAYEHGCPMMPLDEVYGDIDGVLVSNAHDGWRIKNDDDCDSCGEPVELKFEDDKVSNEINLHIAF